MSRLQDEVADIIRQNIAAEETAARILAIPDIANALTTQMLMSVIGNVIGFDGTEMSRILDQLKRDD